MSRRRRHAAAFSLFAFQDIITSVTAIIILLTLLLAVELAQRHASPGPSAESAATAQRLRQVLESARAEAARLQAQLARNEAEIEELAAATPSQLRQRGKATQEQIDRLGREIAELKTRQAQAHTRQTAMNESSAARDGDRRKLAAVRAQAQDDLERVEKLKRQNKLIYNPSPGDAKRAWLVDLQPDRIVTARLGRAEAPMVFDSSLSTMRRRGFMAWVADRSSSSEYFVFLIRPGTIELFAELQSSLEPLGFDIGFDVIGAGQTVIDPVDGAGIK
ncbi:MAG: hypothetical protein WD847_19845 [Pirellulales bacterium]